MDADTKQIKDRVAELGRKIFNGECRQIRSVYVDLEAIQDFSIGALLLWSTVNQKPEWIKYIIERLPAYNERHTHDVGSFFPEIGLTTETISKIARIPDYAKFIGAKSPFTKLADTLVGLLLCSDDMAEIGDNAPKEVHVFVNCCDMIYPNVLKEFFIMELRGKCPRVQVHFLNAQRYELSPDFYRQHDAFIVHDWVQFVLGESKRSSEFFKFKYDAKIFVTHPYKEESKQIPEEIIDSAFSSTEVGMNMFCDFKFINSLVTIEKKETK